MRVSGNSNPTARDFIHFSGRGQVHKPIIGGPKEIADQLERWFVERGCDGFVIAGDHVPGAYEDFVRFVVPELQRRGLFRKDYAGNRRRRGPERGRGAALSGETGADHHRQQRGRHQRHLRARARRRAA